MTEMFLGEKGKKQKIQLILPENLWNIIENYNEYSLEKTLKGHEHWIRSVCVTQNGKQIISSGDDATIKIWDLKIRAKRIIRENSGEFDLPVKTLEGHIGTIMSVCVHSNGKQIISGSTDKTIKIWDLESGKCEKTLRGHAHTITSICVHPNEKQIISGSYDNTIKIWDLESGKCEKTLKGHTDWVYYVCVISNLKQIISGSSDKTIRMWDLETGECRKILLYSCRCGINHIQVHGKRIILCANNLTTKIWHLETGKCRKILNKHTDWDWVESVCVTPDGKQIISGKYLRTIEIWDLEKYELIQILKGHTGSVWSVCIHPNLKQIISGSNDKTIKIWTKGIFNN